MFRRAILAALPMMIAGSPAAASEPTNFGIRNVGTPLVSAPAPAPVASAPTTSGVTWSPLIPGRFDLSAAASIGARWGRVTSTFRSPEHNRRVGGVANSYHLRGRAIDIARRPGVTHAQIAAAFRAAGYQLVESLDEGDHSHFAFAAPGDRLRMAASPPVPEKAAEVTAWRMVSAPTAGALRR